jgi:hypothetical protein
MESQQIDDIGAVQIAFMKGECHSGAKTVSLV